MSAIPRSSPDRLVKSEAGGSVTGHVEASKVQGPPTCSTEVLSSASGHAHGIAGSSSFRNSCSVEHSALRKECGEGSVSNSIASPTRTETREKTGLTCGLPLPHTAVVATEAAGGTARIAMSTGHDGSNQGSGIAMIEMNAAIPAASNAVAVNPASVAAAPCAQQLPVQQLSLPLSHTSQVAGNESSSSAAASVNPRPQTLLPTALDLPFAEAAALLTNGFNRDAGIVQPVPGTPGHPGTSVLASPTSSPSLNAERRKQQKRLLKKLQSVVLEYRTRLGEECAVVATTRRESAHPGFITSEDSRDVLIFGSQILEGALQQQYDSLMHVIKQHNHHIDMATSAAAMSISLGSPVVSTPTSPLALTPGTNASNTPSSHLLPLPPRDVDLMNGNELKSYVPLLLRSLATGRARPMWGSQEHCPPWWPSDVPFRNVRMDTRAADARGDKTWSDCLRQAVKACFRFHGYEDLLRDLPRETSSQKTPMVQVTLAPQKQKAAIEPRGLPAKRTMTSSSNASDLDLNTPTFAMATTQTVPLAGTAIVPGAVPLISGATAVSLANNSLAGSLAAMQGSLPPGMSVISPQAMPQLSILPVARQVRVHFKSQTGTDSCEVINVHPTLTCSQVLDHFGCPESNFHLSTAWTGGTVLSGPLWAVCNKQTDFYLVKQPTPLVSNVSAI